MKHSVFLLTIICGIILTVGVSVAYYNTKTFGFDEDATLITFFDDGVKIMDYYIDYEKAREVADKVSEYIPDESFCCEYNVYNYYI